MVISVHQLSQNLLYLGQPLASVRHIFHIDLMPQKNIVDHLFNFLILLLQTVYFQLPWSLYETEIYLVLEIILNMLQLVVTLIGVVQKIKLRWGQPFYKWVEQHFQLFCRFEQILTHWTADIDENTHRLSKFLLMRLYFYMWGCLVEFTDVFIFVQQGFKTPFVDFGHQLLIVVPEMNFAQSYHPRPPV